MNLKHNYYPYPSKRNVVYAKNGMVATSQNLASDAGLTILKKGGNAVDAAIATAACLTVVEPTSNGIGGDAFALVWMKDTLYGLNGSGASPEAISLNAVKKDHETMPPFGLTPVTVPGAVDAWVTLSKRFGKLPLTEVLAPAIRYAKEGYPLSETLTKSWNNAIKAYKKHLKGPLFDEWFNVFAQKDVYEPGDIFTSFDHAETLRLIGETHGEAFYKGSLADKIDDLSKSYDGYIRKSDLMKHKSTWVEPIKIPYKGYDVWEIPPNGQGLIALEALGILKDDTFKVCDDVNTLHTQIEAMKLAFTDGLAMITDPNKMQVSPSQLLDNAYLKSRRAGIKDTATLPVIGDVNLGGTVYLATADQDGNMVSMIQSNYMGFGSGVVVPGTGIGLQNRGHTFSLDENHINHLAPNKKTFHTIIPGFLTKDNQAIGPFGVMGGFMQPQGHMQVIMNTIDFKLNPQSALDRYRWQWIKDNEIHVEQTMPNHLVKGLLDKGHVIKVLPEEGSFGRGQIIWRNPKTGVLMGGTEKRTDSHISSY